jgi:hypothetical protein
MVIIPVSAPKADKSGGEPVVYSIYPTPDLIEGVEMSNHSKVRPAYLSTFNHPKVTVSSKKTIPYPGTTPLPY